MANGNHDKTASYITHELRAPLKAIQYSLGILKERLAEGDSERNARLLGSTLATTVRLNAIVDDILEMSRIQTGRMSLAKKECDPAQLARETVETFLSWAECKLVKLSLAVEKGTAPVLADPKRVLQVLTNLLSNAIKFTPEGGSVEVRVRAGSRDEAGCMVFSVRDTGCGIAPEDQAKVFRYFVQAGTEDMRAQGSGLGLPLARSLVEMQGGRMRVESRPGEGSVFSFTIPVLLPRGQRPEGPRWKLYPARPEHGGGPRRKRLIST